MPDKEPEVWPTRAGYTGKSGKTYTGRVELSRSDTATYEEDKATRELSSELARNAARANAQANGDLRDEDRGENYGPE